MYKLADIAAILGLDIDTSIAGKRISGIAPLEEAGPDELSFFADERYRTQFEQSRAGVILTSLQENSHPHAVLLRVDHVRAALIRLLEKASSDSGLKPGIHPTAVIHSTAEVDEKAHIGPYVVVGAGCSISRGCIIHAHVTIGNKVSIGDNTVIHSGVRLYDLTRIGRQCIIHANAVIGSDGFGFTPDAQGVYHKVPQMGYVDIADDVEIGANTVIDRATLGKTVIEQGVKLDNLIQIAHNVKIGAHTVIAAQAGIAGSSSIGSNSMIGGQAGIVGHISLPDQTRVQAQSGVTHAPKYPGTALHGSPAMEYRRFLKAYALFRNLPEIIDELRSASDPG